MCKLNLIDKIAFIVCIIASLNWGLIGLFNFNLIAYLTLGTVLLQRIIYIFVFLCSIDLIFLLFKCRYLFDKI